MYPLQGGHATTRGNAVPGTHFTYLLAGCIGVLSRGAVNWGGHVVPYPAGVRCNLAGCRMMGVQCVSV
jgi:hypothetical protein